MAVKQVVRYILGRLAAHRTTMQILNRMRPRLRPLNSSRRIKRMKHKSQKG